MSSELAKITNSVLADEFGAVKARVKVDSDRLKALTGELVRRGKITYVGATFAVQKSVTETKRFDSAAVKIEMGDAWYDARKKAGLSTEWIATAKPPKAA